MDKPNYRQIADSLRAGTCIPFLGAGASMGAGFPSGSALAERLATVSEFPDDGGSRDLALLASYFVQIKEDSLALDRLLRAELSMGGAPQKVHACLAGVHALRLVITTNYDNLIEQAFHGRACWTVVDRGTPGMVCCRLPNAHWEEIEADQLERKIQPAQPIIFKMHGSLDKDDADNDSFLITEEHYVDFLGRPSTFQIPPMLSTLMKRRNFLFLGYGLKDWNVRVMLRKLMLTRNPADTINSWAIVRDASRSERELWRAQGVKIFSVELDEFADRLAAELSPAPPAP